MKKTLLFMVMAVLMLSLFIACSKKTTASSEASETDGKVVYPAGTVVIYGNGQPQFLQEYFDAWLERNRDIAPDVTIEIVQTESAADSREKMTMTNLAGATEDLPDAVFLDPVNAIELAVGGLLKEQTELAKRYESQMVDGALDDITIGGKVLALPESVRPQLLFYNQEIFDKYDIDPSTMTTIEAYVDVGRELKEKSDGTVYLSYVDPGWFTWRYWGRRGLMPQANARIWDEEGNVVIGSDEGTKLAFGTLDTMLQEGLLYKTTMMQPALYDSMKKEAIATFYIGAFWDEFIRQNVPESTGDWRVMPAPVFEDIGTGGAPVTSYFGIVEKGDNVYAGLVEKLWVDFHFDKEPRTEWVEAMVEQSAPYANPISVEMLEDPFWKEPAAFYAGQSFRAMETEGLINPSKNLMVTPQDALADDIISTELETYIAGDQTIEECIANIDRILKDRVGKAETLSN